MKPPTVTTLPPTRQRSQVALISIRHSVIHSHQNGRRATSKATSTPTAHDKSVSGRSRGSTPPAPGVSCSRVKYTLWWALAGRGSGGVVVACCCAWPLWPLALLCNLRTFENSANSCFPSRYGTSTRAHARTRHAPTRCRCRCRSWVCVMGYGSQALLCSRHVGRCERRRSSTASTAEAQKDVVSILRETKGKKAYTPPVDGNSTACSNGGVTRTQAAELLKRPRQ